MRQPADVSNAPRISPIPVPVNLPVLGRRVAAGNPRPFLKWVGGKSQLLDQLKKLYPKTLGTYFEPFLGGGALYFDLRPSRAFLNDINPALIGAYTNLKRRPDTVADILRG